MKLRYGLLVALLCVSNSPAVAADDDGDSLNTILKEIKRLSERVTQLEIRVGRLTAELHAAQQQQQKIRIDSPAKSPSLNHKMQKLRRSHDANETIRLQQVSPGKLLKNIHERERQLRERPFPADVFPN
jgi:septal ring factor EnvC (AmiA/AmiB activator)